MSTLQEPGGETAESMGVITLIESTAWGIHELRMHCNVESDKNQGSSWCPDTCDEM